MPAEDAVHSEKLENVCVFIVGFVHEPCNFFLVTSLDFILNRNVHFFFHHIQKFADQTRF